MVPDCGAERPGRRDAGRPGRRRGTARQVPGRAFHPAFAGDQTLLVCRAEIGMSLE